MTGSIYHSRDKKQVFLSYAFADREVAHNIANKLQQHGCWRIWLVDCEFKVGDSFAEKIGDAISSSDYLIVLLSPNSVKSRWVRKELDSAFARELASRDITLLPVMIADCEVPPFLAQRVLIDLRTDYTSGISRLVQQIGLAPKIDFSRLTPQQFETLVADLFKSAGFSEVQLEVPMRDRRVDIVAKYTAKDPLGGIREEVWLVEVKFYRKERADLQALHQLVGYLVTLPEQYRGVLVTNSQLTSAARAWLEEARKSGHHDIRIVDGTEMRRLLLNYPDIVDKYFPRRAAK